MALDKFQKIFNTLENNKDFIDGRIRAQNLNVVNDTAECGVSLI